MLGFQMNLLDIGGGFSGREDFPVKFEEVHFQVFIHLLCALVSKTETKRDLDH